MQERCTPLALRHFAMRLMTPSLGLPYLFQAALLSGSECILILGDANMEHSSAPDLESRRFQMAGHVQQLQQQLISLYSLLGTRSLQG